MDRVKYILTVFIYLFYSTYALSLIQKFRKLVLAYFVSLQLLKA